MNVKLLIALLCCILLAGLVSAESESMPAEQLTEQVKIEDEQAEAKKKQDEREKIEKEIRDKVEAEFRSEIEALKKEKQELEGQLQNALTVAKYVGYSAIGIVLVIFFGLIITRRKSSDGVNFEARIIDSVTDLLKRKMPNLSGDLKRQISDIIKHNAVPGPSFSSFARAEYNIKKIDENNVSLTVNVLYIVSPSDVAKLTSESIICWDDLPKEIRNDFIQNRKTEQLYLLYKKKIMTIYDKPITDSSIPEGKPKNNAAQEKEAEPVMAFIPRKPQYTLTQ
ncbi:MAG: hypothetical protein LBU65_01930, partial [Planctomycetaceae bacterium]|nr:hypothetical protein [Planctomycetaceae bacterium]